MLLAVNVGNTNTVFGVFDGDELRWSWRISTQPTRTADELGVVLAGLLDQAGLSFTTKITGVAISSVVPPSTTAFREMVETYFSFPALVVEPGVRTGVPILTDNPREVGSDRIVNALAAFERHGGPCIVIDFGTATTYDVVSAKSEFLGGVIAFRLWREPLRKWAAWLWPLAITACIALRVLASSMEIPGGIMVSTWITCLLLGLAAPRLIRCDDHAAERAAPLLDMIAGIEQLDDVRRLAALCRP